MSTLAGSASSGWADGVGTAARFIGTLSITVSSNGDIYVGDSNAIRIVTSSGQSPSFLSTKSSSHSLLTIALRFADRVDVV